MKEIELKRMMKEAQAQNDCGGGGNVKEIAWERIMKEREEAREKYKREDDDEDPYGLAHISTSDLKKELRRRKRWG